MFQMFETLALETLDAGWYKYNYFRLLVDWMIGRSVGRLVSLS